MTRLNFLNTKKIKKNIGNFIQLIKFDKSKYKYNFELSLRENQLNL